MRKLLVLGVPALLVMSFALGAQNRPAYTAVVSGSGYRTPPAITVAPGQITTFFVAGLPQTAAGLPEVVAVLSTAGQTQQVQILSTKVLDSETLAITVQIPFGAPASTNEWFTSTFTIQFAETPNPTGNLCAQGACTEPASLNGVFAAPHLINMCDLLVGSGASSSNCVPAVTHQSGALVTGTAPASPGEIVTAWAVGLGAPSGAVPAERGVPIQMNDITLMVSFALALSGGPTVTQPLYFGVNTPYIWAGIPTPNVGLYQINFAIPQWSMSDLAPCMGTAGNALITVGRMTSSLSLFGATGATDTGAGSICVASN